MSKPRGPPKKKKKQPEDLERLPSLYQFDEEDAQKQRDRDN